MDKDTIIDGLVGKSAAALGDSVPDEVRNKTPEQLRELVEIMDAHLRSLHQTDTGELRDLSTEENAAFEYGLLVRDAAMKRIEHHRSVSSVFERRPEAVKRVYANIRNGLDDQGSVVRMRTHEARDAALRVLDDRGSAAHLRSDEKDHLERQVRVNTDVARRILVTENEAYRSAWMKLVTTPDGAMFLEDEERQAMRAYAEYRAASLTNASGGYGVPVKLAA